MRRSQTTATVSITSVRAAGHDLGQSVGILGHTVDAIDMTVEGAEEGLGEDPFQFHSVQCPRIFTSLFEGMERWVQVTTHLVDVRLPGSCMVHRVMRDGLDLLHSASSEVSGSSGGHGSGGSNGGLGEGSDG